MTHLQIKCPRCGQKTDWHGNPARPFCSEDCRLVDLGRWATENYAIAGERAVPPENDSEPF